jgi:transposase
LDREWRTLGPRQLGAEVLDAREVQGIFGLLGRGWQVKAIARELGMARNTVRAWVRRGPDAPRPRTGRPLALVGNEDWLKARFLAGVRNADVLRQELAERGVLVSIRTVERFVSPLRAEAMNTERATLRFETDPGQQMQIDFGEKWIEVAGERVKAFVFVATLGYSRSTFAHVYPTLRQRHWLEGLEAALHHFAGVPEACVVDNAKALVLRWQGDRPVFHPEFEAFCRHWGMKPRACRPYRPRTKGKVERGVGYVKGNALGRVSWASWEALHGHLIWWMREVADVRTHGTTGERPMDRLERERKALLVIGHHPSYLRARRFTRKVTGDCRVEFETNRYSVPYHLVGRTVDVEVEGGELVVHWAGQAVAEHRITDGRHRDTQDPGHVEGLVRRTYKAPRPCELQRPLSDYEAVVGGERW